MRVRRRQSSYKRAQRRRTRKLRGGSIINKSDPKLIVYYSCYFGPENDYIPDLPSATHECIFFSNNDSVLERVAQKGWKTVRDMTPIKGNLRDDSVDSKELKACPHHYEQLRGYTYTCYMDSKLKVKDEDVYAALPLFTGDVVMLMNKHSNQNMQNNIWYEYVEAMDQPRYSQNSRSYLNLIRQHRKNGMKYVADIHYESGFILRKSGELAEKIGEEWFQDIKNTGAECQISFFFIQQKYKDNTRTI